ncbi:DUF3038 domain-containing protein [Chamaesiphon sp. VAR_69_metabat_338]|uniref:DUF3038 domain-containing protein n=1 Tax=Chamaesiphon sp. VAR_69_metabat_338 TaxID=2964704 RepID=UPI00286E6A8B|nr:DUF3038 domain-containing protein [Chamaesiphon sp. VAR_69_metabat_338]
MPASTPKLDDLLLDVQLSSSQLAQISTELNEIVTGIAALTQVDRVELAKIARDLQVEAIVSDWIDDWSLDRAARQTQFTVQQIRAVVTIVNQLTQQHQSTIRQHLNYLHQTIEDRQLPIQSPALADYINNFMTIDRVRSSRSTQSLELLETIALNVLLGLLFYSSPNGHQRLWTALLQRSHHSIVRPSGN